jgi:hypothetical protein
MNGCPARLLHSWQGGSYYYQALGEFFSPSNITEFESFVDHRRNLKSLFNPTFSQIF